MYHQEYIQKQDEVKVVNQVSIDTAMLNICKSRRRNWLWVLCRKHKILGQVINGKERAKAMSLYVEKPR
jgi:hypothetical protein